MASAFGTKIIATRLVSYAHSTRNIRSLVSQIRRFSERTYEEPGNDLTPAGQKSIAWPDEKMGPLNIPDLRFALPGNVGLPSSTPSSSASNGDLRKDELLPEGDQDRQLTVISQLISESDYLDPEDRPDTTMAEGIFNKYFENARVELSIQDCPKILLNDFAILIPDMPKGAKVSVITITQRTKNDMSGWSEEVETERDELLENFMKTASEICHMLKAHNCWCDFIDPSSGQPYFSPYTNTTFYETDERYRHLGFCIEDLGCCKVIYHKKWGSKVFVGSIFTTATTEHVAMQDLFKVIENKLP